MPICLKAKAVIFDMDGVITDTMPFHFRAWKKIFQDEGFHVTECEIYLREGQPGSATLKEIFKEHGVPYKEEDAKRILLKKEKLFKRILRRRFVPGSRQYLHFLKKQGFQLGLVTGTARHEAHKILPKGLFRLFDVTITGNDVKKGKPHPEPYLLALKKLKIKPREAVVIENAPFGIHAAKQANIRCLALESSLPRKYLQAADHIFSSFKELRRTVIIDALVVY
jgi:beta-phosphoglucomutase